MFFDRDGNKDISIAELITTMKELGDLLTTEEITTFVSIMDKNADGVVGVSGLQCGFALEHTWAALWLFSFMFSWGL